MDTLYMVIPAYNEEANIETVARQWHQVLVKTGPKSRLLIIDDGSKDRTYEILLSLKEELPQLLPLSKPNAGHGATLLYGYQYALNHGADYIFQTDSDGQTLPKEFGPFWKHRHQYDVIIGYRKHRQDGISRVFVTKTLKFVLGVIFHLRIPDANTPFRLMSADVLQGHIGRVPHQFNLSNVMLTVLFMNAKEKVRFVPITFRPRQGGVNSINLKKITKIGIKAVQDFYQINREIKKNER